MLSNADYLNQSVAIESGTTLMRGTITRWSKTSVWATFEEDGRTYRFVRSQDGAWRRFGTASNQQAPVLLWTGDPETGERDAPVNPQAGNPAETPQQEAFRRLGDLYDREQIDGMTDAEVAGILEHHGSRDISAPVVETPDLRDASLSLLAQVAQSREIAALLELARILQARNDDAQRFGENDAVAVESVMGHLKLAVEAAQRGQRR